MNMFFHQTLLFLTFWLMSIKYTSSMTFLYPHTLQQMKPMEKMQTDMIMTTTITTSWTMINNIITKQMKSKNIKNTMMHTLMPLTMMTSMNNMLPPILKIMNTHMNNNNLITTLSMKKFYQTTITLTLLSMTFMLFLKKSKNIKTLNRMTYFPLITLISVLTPSEPLLTMMIMTSIMMPLETSKMMKNMSKNYKSS